MSAGFYGKLPARGDFVRAGLPRGFVEPWDEWAQRVVAGSREMMGEDWLAAWLEAPVWRFLLPPGLCGAGAALGVMLPSVDRVGRYFPLVFAAVFGTGYVAPEGTEAESWLDGCEAAGRAAIENAAPPETVASLLPALSPLPLAGVGREERSLVPPPSSLWWTEGAPRVAATRLELESLPDAAFFASMIGMTDSAERCV